MANYANNGWAFFAPNVIVSEVLYVLCQKFQDGMLTETEYDESVEDFQDQLSGIRSLPNGDFSLIKRAKEIRQNYGCSRSSDSLYIALAEELATSHNVELLTFDTGFINQAAKNAPAVKVNLLPV
ncbi:MAG: type II toxin-antitoxin system VapC family toxin [Acidobacteriota bacterium]|nr:type II toxin-antitoxin system VapC family toxin [Acidobacteriota bacterium]